MRERFFRWIFDEAWNSRIYVTVDEVSLPIIGRAELIENKRAVGRLQDLADADELEKVAAADELEKVAAADGPQGCEPASLPPRRRRQLDAATAT